MVKNGMWLRSAVAQAENVLDMHDQLIPLQKWRYYCVLAFSLCKKVAFSCTELHSRGYVVVRLRVSHRFNISEA